MKHNKIISIGISACLTGEPVRYDGGHTYIAELCEYLSSIFILVPVCPELAVGMGVPRAPIQLSGEPGTARARGVDSPSLDVTDKLSAFARRTLQSQPALDGFVVKARSPSCGLDTTPLFDNNDQQTGIGSGVFTRTLCAARPAMPFIDESCAGKRIKMERFVLQACIHAAFRRQVLLAEDRQTALVLFRQNLASIAGKKITPHIILPDRIPASIDPEAFIKQYMGWLREQSLAEDQMVKCVRRATRLDTELFFERVTSML